MPPLFACLCSFVPCPSPNWGVVGCVHSCYAAAVARPSTPTRAEAWPVDPRRPAPHPPLQVLFYLVRLEPFTKLNRALQARPLLCTTAPTRPTRADARDAHFCAPTARIQHHHDGAHGAAGPSSTPATRRSSLSRALPTASSRSPDPAGRAVRPRRPYVPLVARHLGWLPGQHRRRQGADSRVLLLPRVPAQRQRLRPGRASGGRRAARALPRPLRAALRRGPAKVGRCRRLLTVCGAVSGAAHPAVAAKLRRPLAWCRAVRVAWLSRVHVPRLA